MYCVLSASIELVIIFSSTRAASTSGFWRNGLAPCARWTSSSTTGWSTKPRRKRKQYLTWLEYVRIFALTDSIKVIWFARRSIRRRRRRKTIFNQTKNLLSSNSEKENRRRNNWTECAGNNINVIEWDKHSG